MSEITVIDAIMGTGKTQWAIQRMNEAESTESFIYITPFLKEVERVKHSVTSRKFVEPTVYNSTSKLEDLKRLIASNRDIVSTHALFARADEEVIELLEQSGYTLILDEVMDVVDSVPIKNTDIKRLQTNGDIRIIESEGRVEWIGDPEDSSRYRDIRELAQAGNLYLFRNSFMVWAFPPAVFRAFPRVTILTYLFNCQLQRYYFDLFDFEYSFKSVVLDGDKYQLSEYEARKEKRDELYKMIEIYDGKLNDIGEGKFALSMSKLAKYDADTLSRIKKNTANYFRHYAKAKRADAYLSTLKEVEPFLTPSGFKKSVIAHNERATNEYGDRWAIAYLLNRFVNRNKATFFQDNGVSVDEDLYAVSELLQWIWRSRIRNGQPIKLYLPSSRMRGLLKQWANYEI